MPTFDLADLSRWLGALLLPFCRIGACFMTAPVFGAAYVPPRIRILLAGAVTLLVAPLLPAPPAGPLLSAASVTAAVQQVLIGAAIGFGLQLTFDALTMGGQLIANGMGLGMAFNVDPLRGASSPALGQLYVVLGTLTFLALDGHQALLQLLVESFRTLPVGPDGFEPSALQQIADWGGNLCAGALRVALPGVTALLVVNLAFGAISRAAPALNLFAVGLPVTLLFGLAIAVLGLAAAQQGFVRMLSETFGLLHTLLRRG